MINITIYLTIEPKVPHMANNNDQNNNTTIILKKKKKNLTGLKIKTIKQLNVKTIIKQKSAKQNKHHVEYNIFKKKSLKLRN